MLALERMTALFVALGSIVGTAACVATSGSNSGSDSGNTFSETFDFALIGDMPYTADDMPRFDRLVRDVNAHQPTVEWVLHVGDIRGGGKVPCSNEVLSGRFALMQGFASAFVLTPGDNDYIDCREVDPYERLAYLRKLFFPDPSRTTGGRPMTVDSQSTRKRFEAFVENAMWTKGGVVFATFHAIGVDDLPDPYADLTAARNAAAIAWIEEAFEHAREIDAAGVFLATQVEPWGMAGPPGTARRVCRGGPGKESPCLGPRGGFEPLYGVLEKAVVAFGKPVVLATGDLHYFRVDKPLLVESTHADKDPRTVENFTRVETFGSPYIHWVRIGVDPRDRDVFSFHPEVIRENGLEGSSSR